MIRSGKIRNDVGVQEDQLDKDRTRDPYWDQYWSNGKILVSIDPGHGQSADGKKSPYTAFTNSYLYDFGDIKSCFALQEEQYEIQKQHKTL